MRIALASLASIMVCAAASGAPWPPWTGISRGGGPLAVPSGGSAGAVVIASRRQLDAFPYLTVHPAHAGCCDWYETFDWRHRVVLLVMAILQHEFEITALARRRDTLRIAIGPRYRGQPDFAAPTALWETVSLPRSLLGRPLPRRIVVTATRTPPLRRLVHEEGESAVVGL